MGITANDEGVKASQVRILSLPHDENSKKMAKLGLLVLRQDLGDQVSRYQRRIQVVCSL